jgi:hypothetical protein
MWDTIIGFITAVAFFTAISITIGLLYGKHRNWKR